MIAQPVQAQKTINAPFVVLLIKSYLTNHVKIIVKSIIMLKDKFVMVLYYSNLDCHWTCEECINSGKADCIECDSPLMLWENQCLEKCPARTYPAPEICLPCESPCDECETKEKCLSCSEGFYWYNEECPKSCPDGMFPNDATRTCDTCNEACLTCYGPSSKECFECNYFEKYNRTYTKDCKLLQCEEASYVSINYEERIVECLECYKACASCNGGNKTDCLECKKGYLSFPTNKEGKVTCKTCSEINIGYYTETDGSCQGKVLFN